MDVLVGVLVGVGGGNGGIVGVVDGTSPMGIVSSCPGEMRSQSASLLNEQIASTVTPYRAPMLQRVSPGCTTWTIGVGVSEGRGLAVTVGKAASAVIVAIVSCTAWVCVVETPTVGLGEGTQPITRKSRMRVTHVFLIASSQLPNHVYPHRNSFPSSKYYRCPLTKSSTHLPFCLLIKSGLMADTKRADRLPPTLKENNRLISTPSNYRPRRDTKL